jgi:hypothetical protein
MSENDELQDEDLARAYRKASREQPPAALDARILAAARAAARPAVAATPTFWTSGWRIPLALAATVLLSFTVTLLVHEAEQHSLALPDDSGGGARQLPRSAGDQAESKTRTVAPVPAVPPLPPPRSPGPRRTEPAAAAAEPRAQPGAGPAAGGASAPEAGTTAQAFTPDPAAAGNVSREQKAMRAAAAAPAGEGTRPALTKDQEAGRDNVRAESAAPAPRAAPAAAAQVRADTAERALRSPEQWLADVRRLRQEGKLAEAGDSLAEFRKRYPQYSLPEDLK